MNGLGIFRRRRHVRLHHLEDEEIILVAQAAVGEPALEIGVALRDQRRADLVSLLGGQLELGELVDARARAVADLRDGGGKLEGRHIDYAFAAAADELVAVIALGDDAADQRRR